MKKTRFTAIFLCLTMLFAMFTGGAYAESGVTYIDETTIVIEDGKVVSGDASLVDKGIIVIGDEEDAATDSSDLSGSTGSTSSGKTPVKDNSALLNPDSSTGETQSGVSLPDETINAVNPDAPTESAKAAIVKVDSANSVTQTSLNGSGDTWAPASSAEGFVFDGTYTIPNNINTNNNTKTISLAVAARGNCTVYSKTTYTPFFVVKTGGTLNLSNQHSTNDGRVTLEGLLFYHTTHTLSTLKNQWNGDTSSYWPAATKHGNNGESFYPMIRLEGGTANISETTLQNGWSAGAITTSAPQNGCGAAIRILSGTLNLSKGTNGNSKILDCTSQNYGGAIYVESGTATLDGVDISGCKAANGGAIYVAANGKAIIKGTSTISNCTATSTGGAIYVASGGELEISSTTISGCKAAHGGAIYLAGNCTVTLNSVTIQNNTATTNGGAIWMGPTVTINHTGGTISGNEAESGIGGAIAIARPGTYNLKGGTISGNTAVQGGAIGCYASNTSDPGNPKFIMTSGTISGNTATSTSQGGGAIYIRCGSEHSISGGTITGNKAITGGGIYVYSHADYTNAAIADGKITISGSAKIYKNGNTSTTNGGGAYVGSGGTLAMSAGSIGDTAANTNVATNGKGVYVASGGTFEMTGGEIKNHTGTTGNGGGVYVTGGTFRMSGSAKITGNAANYGGGVYATGACTINVNGAVSTTSVSSNTANNQGGGFYFSAVTSKDSININNVTINGNTATTNRGGGILINLGEANKDNIIRISGATISNNTAEPVSSTDSVIEGHGGGVYLAYAKLYVDNTTFSGNSATVRGGGLYCTTGSVAEVKSCAFTGNETKGLNSGVAWGRGGGLYVYYGAKVTVIKSSFDGNSSNTHSGGIGIDGEDAGNLISYLDLIEVNVGTATANSATGNGGGVFVGDRAVVNIVRGNFSNNTAANGGGIYAEDYSTSTGTVLKISDNTNILTTVPSGVAATGTGTVISNNTATTGNGGGFYALNASDCTITNAEIYLNKTLTDTPDESNGTSYITTGTTGNGGGIYAENSTLNMSGCTVGKLNQPNSAFYGAGIAVFKGSTVTATNVKVEYNIASKSGGGYFVLGCGINDPTVATTISVSGGSVSYNRVEATDFKLPDESGEEKDLSSELGGGGFHIRGLSDYNGKGVTATIDNVTLNENAAVRGGAIYLHEASTLTFKNCSNVKQNNAGYMGGALFMAKGKSKADIDNCVFTENVAGIRGGCLYIQVDGCTVKNSEMIRNKAEGVTWSANKGGAIYVTTPTEAATTVNLPLTNVYFEGNESQYGGAICAADGAYPINITISASGSNACNFESNIATKSGGAILVSGTNAKVTMTEGFIINNKAGETASTVSPYQLAYTASEGVGGGIAVFNGGSFSLTGSNIAIYGNTATTAGNDVFANGKNTSLEIPAPTAMNTTGYGKDGAVWWEDYMDDDANYGYGLNGESRVVARYANTPISIRAYTTSTEGTSPSGEYINDAGQYVAITFDVQKYNVGSIKITAPDATDENQRFVFTVSGTTTLGEPVNFSVSLPAGESVTIAKMLPGSYTVTMQGSWSWRYTLDGAENATVTITGLEVDELHEVTYSASRTEPHWLNHNSPIETNKATPTVAASMDIAEFKKNYVI